MIAITPLYQKQQKSSFEEISSHICDRAAEDKQVEKTGSKSDLAFTRYRG